MVVFLEQKNVPGSTPQSLIRNFCIIAHIDHGKSTVADRILQLSGVVSAHDMRSQYLDRMDIERERGITIKSQAVRVPWTVDGQEYTLGMIDTPGHVDFTYEVSRSLAACEGAVLLVDATQGIEAQTLSNLYMAIDDDLTIIPVLNKIDLPSAMPDKCADEIANLLGCDSSEVLRVSGKTGDGVAGLLDAIVRRVPAPAGDPDAPARALVFDSEYDPYRGIVTYIRMVDGEIRSREKVLQMGLGSSHDPIELGVISPAMKPTTSLGAGEVGYIITGVKEVSQSKVGDTITTQKNPATQALPGYREPQPMVYAGLFPMDTTEFPALREALDKLKLNDASLVYTPETSVALGFGFRCGFLGMLHMEVIQERLEREFDLDLVTTLPSVIYDVYKTDGTLVRVDNPHNYPDPGVIEHAEEPFVKVTIVTPPDYVGNIMPMCQDRRGEFKDMQYLDTFLVELHYEMPLNEIIYDFFDTLKANTKGYASLDYELSGYRPSELVKVDLLLNGDQVDALSFIAHKDKAYPRARKLCEKLKENIPRQLFEVPVQAAIGGRVIARETVKAMRKDVLAKCYGGDITRKKKLLEKQKEGKKKMRSLGTVQVPTEAFLAVLKLDE